MTIINNKQTLDAALKLAKGSYQRDILLGRQNLSGSDLRGAAKNYAGRYRQSSANLIARIKTAGLKVYEQIGDHNRRDLIID